MAYAIDVYNMAKIEWEGLDVAIDSLYYIPMSIIEHAGKVLTEAEQSLRNLIEQGVKEQAYADVAKVAHLAAGLSRLRSLPEAPSRSTQEKERPLRETKRTAKPRKAARTDTRLQFPRFERDGDRLVKVGWSKKSREAYEHRASRQTLAAFARHLMERVQVGALFSVEEILPVLDGTTGAELPAYQVYLGVAWLRNAGVLEKKGRDGYILRQDSLEDEGFARLWDAVPARVS